MDLESITGGPISRFEELIIQLATPILGEDRIKIVLDKNNFYYYRIGAMLLLCAYLIVGPGAQLVSNTVGYVYPAYCSIRALESRSTADDTRWLTYWVVYSSFTLVDTFSGFLLSWLPLYWLAKVMFLVWCFMPSEFNGSDIIYNHVILPFFKKHEKKIDKAMGKAEKVVQNIAEQAERITQSDEVVL